MLRRVQILHRPAEAHGCEQGYVWSSSPSLQARLRFKAPDLAYEQALKANLAKDTQLNSTLSNAEFTLFWSRKTDETREKVWTKSAQAAAAEMN